MKPKRNLSGLLLAAVEVLILANAGAGLCVLLYFLVRIAQVGVVTIGESDIVVLTVEIISTAAIIAGIGCLLILAFRKFDRIAKEATP